MCRNIKMLFNFDPPVTDEEIRAASLQFVRKVSGFSKPSKANESAFLSAVDEIRPYRRACWHRLRPMHLRAAGKKKRPRRRRATQSVSEMGRHVRDERTLPM